MQCQDTCHAATVLHYHGGAARCQPWCAMRIRSQLKRSSRMSSTCCRICQYEQQCAKTVHTASGCIKKQDVLQLSPATTPHTEFTVTVMLLILLPYTLYSSTSRCIRHAWSSSSMLAPAKAAITHPHRTNTSPIPHQRIRNQLRPVSVKAILALGG